MSEYDLAIIGSGPGGYVAAVRAADLGLKTVCIEEKDLGGTCLNVGCIPSKALLHSSEMLYLMKSKGMDLGITVADLGFDFTQMMNRKEKIVKEFQGGVSFLLKSRKVTHIQGRATLMGPNALQVGNEEIQAKHILLATGSEPISLPFLPFDEKQVLSSTGALALTDVPKKMLIIGAGIIGIELGSVYSRLGTEVIFIEFLDRVAPSLDGSISKEIEKILTKQGMKFYLSHKAKSAKIEKDRILLTAESEGKEQQFTADKVLVAIGRKPNTHSLGLEKVGVKIDRRGFIEINDQFQTSIPSIYAIGDIVDGPMLAHKASDEGTVCVENICNHKSSLNYMAVPSIAYTSPEAASVGLTEERAKELNLLYQTASSPMKINSRAKCTSEEEGFVKLIAHSSGKLIGAHILSAHASELIHELALAIDKNVTIQDLKELSHAHPTLSETIKETASLLCNKFSATS